MYFYSDTPTARSGNVIPYHRMKANENYLRHYDNYLFLSFISIKGTMQERHQVAKELTICERKLKWWANHGNFVQEEVKRGVAELKHKWQLPDIKQPGIS